jgi:hypothetical protein
MSDAPRARPKRIRPAPEPLRWRRAPWLGLALVALIAGVLNALGVGKPRPAASAPAPRWQAVVAPDGGYAYDVPPDWEPAPATQQNWPGIRLVTSALLGRGPCGTRGGAGVVTTQPADPEAAARKAAADVAAGAYGGVARLGPATHLDGTSAPARLVVAEVEPAATGECAAKHAVVVALATTGAVVVAYADTDRAGSPARADLVGIVRSYRGTTYR